MSDHKSNMNAFDREIITPYLLGRDGYRCNKCHVTAQYLIKLSKIKEKETGKKRKMPVLVVNCKDNSGNHRFDIYDSTSMSNFELLCYPCNRNVNLHKPDLSISTGPEPSREKKDSMMMKPTYHRNLQTYLLDNQEGCQAEIMMNSNNFSEGGNQVTVKRYFEDELYTNTNKKGKYQIFPHRCNSPHCNNVHVCLTGTQPTKLLDQERQRLEGQWWVEYGDKRDKWKTHTAYSGKSFMEQKEFIASHCLLLSHNFK